jgi:hypothetical protein
MQLFSVSGMYRCIWRSGGIAPPLLTSTLDAVVSITPRHPYPRYPLTRRLGWPQSRSGPRGEEKKIISHVGSRNPINLPAACSYTDSRYRN